MIKCPQVLFLRGHVQFQAGQPVFHPAQTRLNIFQDTQYQISAPSVMAVALTTKQSQYSASDRRPDKYYPLQRKTGSF